jgi:hypothetical protein
MGGSSWSDSHYTDRVAIRDATHTPTFAHDAAVRAGTARTTIHETLDPKNIKGVRESRDSDAHPNSKPVAVFFDVTGSMKTIPRQLQTVLPKLMGLLLRKGYITDPQVLMGAIGDCHSSNRNYEGGYGFGGDQAPLQVGQFESGIEMDNDLTNMFLEGAGGGQSPPQESYELAFYTAARKTSFDAFEKRGQKGYLFTIGDERPYPEVTKEAALAIFGDTLEVEAIPTTQLVKEVQERWETFHIIPLNAAHGHDRSMRKAWEDLLGVEYVLTIDDANNICELIGSTIGVMEGTTDQEAVVADLKDVGTSASDAKSVSRALDGVTTLAAKKGVGTKRDTELTERL